jgi:esterase/lipase
MENEMSIERATSQIAQALVKVAALEDELNELEVLSDTAVRSLNSIKSEYIALLAKADPRLALATVKAIRAARGEDNTIVDIIGKTMLDKP